MNNQLYSDWEDVKDIVIYGYGKVARNMLSYFTNNFNVKYIVDGDIKKDNLIYEDIPVYHIDRVRDELKNYKIVIATAQRNALSISKVLKEEGLVEYEDFCSVEKFISEWFWRFRNKICLMEVHTSITTKCTLKCTKCNMFMPYYKNPMDYSAEDIKKDLKVLFQNVDYVFSYRILGGEPLINRDLSEILQFIGENYKNKIGDVGIITNGTILPDNRLLEVSKKYDVKYYISDYTNQVNYKDRLNTVVSKLHDSGIYYEITQSFRWCDFGFPCYNVSLPNEGVREHMLECGPIFHGINDGKFYYCHVAWSAEKCGLIKLNESDYVDLTQIDSNSSERRKQILEHSQGNINGGFVSLCAKCGGCGNDNKNYVDAAEQMR